MYFYKLEKDGETVFATASDVTLPEAQYTRITREEYEAWTGEEYREEESPEEKIARLQAELAATGKKMDAVIQSNAMLEDCLVEMAEAVYA